MKLFKFLKPRPTISDREMARGLRFLTLEGALRAAEGIGLEAVAEVVDALPDEVLENRPKEE